MCVFFFFNDTATTEIYTLSLHDALPISAAVIHEQAIGEAVGQVPVLLSIGWDDVGWPGQMQPHGKHGSRSEEHTSELQSRQYLVCRLLLEKKKSPNSIHAIYCSTFSSRY